MNLFRKKNVQQVMTDAKMHPGDEELFSLKKSLTVRDLAALGIAAVVGAGIFSTIGKAAYDGGPGIIFLFIFVAIACGFSALCYAEFASMVPVSGSAYTYAYVAFGEIIAWIIGWDLLMEYAIGNIVVAISWSDYFTHLLSGIGINIPAYLATDYWTAQARGSEAAILAWNTAPMIGQLRLICDIPAFLIVLVITYITYRGIKESKQSANLMVLLKLIVILMVIGIGAFYVSPANWNDFFPNGATGVLKGISAVFFAYIGFDAISTTAEECENPQRDLPRGMIYALIICTVLYVLVALVLTGMVPYYELNVGEPLAYVFSKVGLNWVAGVIAISAVIATASVLLVFQIGQPRIWMSMSRDGLLPKVFSTIHPKYGTPSFSTILTGIIVAIPALIANIDFMVDLTSIGTLFAFALVAAGILYLESKPDRPTASFRVPFISSKIIYPITFFAVMILWIYNNYDSFLVYLGFFEPTEEIKHPFRHALPHYGFLLLCLYLVYFSIAKRTSLIPLLGLLSCGYLLSESGATNWERFFIWLVVGLIAYFLYSYGHSKLNKQPKGLI